MQARKPIESGEVSCPFPHASGATGRGRGSGRRPPMVEATPLIGPVRQFAGDVMPFLNETRRTYGDAFRMRILGVEMTCLCGPDALALMEDDEILCTTKAMQVLEKITKSTLTRTFDGPHHKLYRKIHTRYLNRSLEREKRDQILGCLRSHTADWHPGRRLDVLDVAQVQTVAVLSLILNGEPLPFDSRDVSIVVHTLIFASYGHVPTWIALANPVFRSAYRRMHAHFLDLVARVRADPALAADTLIGQYLDFPPPEHVGRWENSDLVIVPFAAYLAGFDTVASAASFLLHELLRHPECLERVRQEHRELERDEGGHVDPMQQEYLRAAFLETMRLHPPGAMVIRHATRDFEFAGFTIRKGDEILVQISGDHLDEDLFPEPHEFDPTRFLVAEASDLKRHVLPFGSGAHRCTGALVGQLFAEEMVSYWIHHFDLELIPESREIRVAARPFTQPVGLQVEVTGRRVVGG
ncbi:MAG: cytochrome P450 [Alphaproteobacteria bacterium]